MAGQVPSEKFPSRDVPSTADAHGLAFSTDSWNSNDAFKMLISSTIEVHYTWPASSQILEVTTPERSNPSDLPFDNNITVATAYSSHLSQIEYALYTPTN